MNVRSLDMIAVSCLSDEQLEDLAAGLAAGGPESPPVDPEHLRHLERCAECRSAVRRIEEDNRVIASCLAAQRTSQANDGESLAAYEIRGELSRGGQGVVFDAIQRATGRRVALKRLAAGRFSTSRQRRRFEREIELVASLRHPNIVALYEAGTTAEGDAYFAMEFVDGLPLDRHIERRRAAGAATIEEVLGLCVRICRAVSHAHQRGVIHRDLKPGNILVDHEGEPRVLDFGLARSIAGAQERLSRDGTFAGTLVYAAPEQLGAEAGAADVRSDVYALGVVMHEALTGVTPCGACASLEELVRRKSEPLAVRPRALCRAIDGDTETIVLKALAVDPEWRYQSVAELREDLERRLAGRPITARQESIVYVLAKLAARHRVAVSIGAAVVAAMLALGSTLVATRAGREQERIKAVDTLSAFRQALAAADPLSGGRGDSLGSYLDAVEANLETHLDDQPDASASLLNTLGEISLGAADFDAAERRFEQALSLARRHHDAPHATVAESLHNLGRVEFFRGRFAEAGERYRAALAMRQSLHGDSHPEVANSMSHLGSTLRRQGEFEAAERLFRQALAIRLADSHSTDPDIAAAWNNLGSLLLERGRHAEAHVACERALEMIEATVGADDWRVAQALRNRAACLLGVDQVEPAALDLERAVRIWSARVESDHPSLASTQQELAAALLRLGRLDEADALCATSLEAHRRRLGEAHPRIFEGLLIQSEILRARGRSAEAAETMSVALELGRRVLPAHHPDLARAEAEAEAQQRAAVAAPRPDSPAPPP